MRSPAALHRALRIEHVGCGQRPHTPVGPFLLVQYTIATGPLQCSKQNCVEELHMHLCLHDGASIRLRLESTQRAMVLDKSWQASVNEAQLTAGCITAKFQVGAHNACPKAGLVWILHGRKKAWCIRAYIFDTLGVMHSHKMWGFAK